MTKRQSNRFGKATIDYKDLYMEVGSVFFVWSRLEVALKQSINALMADEHQKAPHGIARTLDRWKELHASISPLTSAHFVFIEEMFLLMCDGLAIRNRIAHGLNGWSVEAGSMDGAYVVTVVNSEELTIYLAHLKSLNGQLNAIASHMDRITSIATHPEAFRDIDIYGEIRKLLKSM